MSDAGCACIRRGNHEAQLDPAFGVGGTLNVASAPPPGTDFGDQGMTVAIAPDGGILVGSTANTDASSSHLVIGLAKLVGDTLFGSGFESD